MNLFTCTCTCGKVSDGIKRVNFDDVVHVLCREEDYMYCRLCYHSNRIL